MAKIIRLLSLGLLALAATGCDFDTDKNSSKNSNSTNQNSVEETESYYKYIGEWATTNFKVVNEHDVPDAQQIGMAQTGTELDLKNSLSANAEYRIAIRFNGTITQTQYADTIEYVTDGHLGLFTNRTYQDVEVDASFGWTAPIDEYSITKNNGNIHELEAHYLLVDFATIDVVNKLSLMFADDGLIKDSAVDIKMYIKSNL